VIFENFWELEQILHPKIRPKAMAFIVSQLVNNTFRQLFSKAKRAETTSKEKRNYSQKKRETTSQAGRRKKHICDTSQPAYILFFLSFRI
jgi:hypothetical protein